MSDPVITVQMIDAALDAEGAGEDREGYTDRSCMRAALTAALKLARPAIADAAFAAGYARAREEAAKVADAMALEPGTVATVRYPIAHNLAIDIRALPIPTTAPTRE